MSKRLLRLLALSALLSTTAPAQDDPPAPAAEQSAAAKPAEPKPKPAVRRTAPKPLPKATPAPVATPEPARKTGFFQRIFRPRERLTPMPSTPSATPAATPAARKARRPLSATPAAATPEPDGTEPKATPAPRKGRTKTPPVADKKGLPPAPPADADPEVIDKYKYDVARMKAMEDPEVQQLKIKSDTAGSDEDATKAQRAYSRALFEKMRSIEPSLKERIDRMEASFMRRLDAQPTTPQ